MGGDRPPACLHACLPGVVAGLRRQRGWWKHRAQGTPPTGHGTACCSLPLSALPRSRSLPLVSAGGLRAQRGRHNNSLHCPQPTLSAPAPHPPLPQGPRAHRGRAAAPQQPGARAQPGGGGRRRLMGLGLHLSLSTWWSLPSEHSCPAGSTLRPPLLPQQPGVAARHAPASAARRLQPAEGKPL